MTTPIRIRVDRLERHAGPVDKIDLSWLSVALRQSLRVTLEDLTARRISQGEAEARAPQVLAAGE
jgi:hypothetical protein